MVCVHIKIGKIVINQNTYTHMDIFIHNYNCKQGEKIQIQGSKRIHNNKTRPTLGGSQKVHQKM